MLKKQLEEIQTTTKSHEDNWMSKNIGLLKQIKDLEILAIKKKARVDIASLETNHEAQVLRFEERSRVTMHIVDGLCKQCVD